MVPGYLKVSVPLCLCASVPLWFKSFFVTAARQTAATIAPPDRAAAARLRGAARSQGEGRGPFEPRQGLGPWTRSAERHRRRLDMLKFFNYVINDIYYVDFYGIKYIIRLEMNVKSIKNRWIPC